MRDESFPPSDIVGAGDCGTKGLRLIVHREDEERTNVLSGCKRNGRKIVPKPLGNASAFNKRKIWGIKDFQAGDFFFFPFSPFLKLHTDIRGKGNSLV